MKRTLSVLAVTVASAWSLAACSQMAETQSNGLSGIQSASELQCSQAIRDYTQAVDNFSILEGRAPKDETELVPKYLALVSGAASIESVLSCCCTEGDASTAAVSRFRRSR